MKKRDFSKGTIKKALKILGKKNLIFIIHDASFPSVAGEDTGRGSPYSIGAEDFYLFIKELGFTGVQLGPQGLTSPVNPSPYDGTVFSKNILSIDLKPLTAPNGYFCGILDKKIYRQALIDNPTDNDSIKNSFVKYKRICTVQEKTLKASYKRFMELVAGIDNLQPNLRRSLSKLMAGHSRFIEDNRFWLESDALFEALRIEHGTENWHLWKNRIDSNIMKRAVLTSPEGRKRLAGIKHKFSEITGFYRFCQFIVHFQHEKMRRYMVKMRLKLFGDLQVGYSCRDEWAYREVFLDKYRMGAPPSRTNPEGQPWNYPLYDPEQLFKKSSQKALKLILNRVGKMLKEFDGIRIDHPHGFVDPWGYRASEDDPYKAVQNGARILSSPCLKTHPELQKFSIARLENINTDPLVPPYSDNWVTSLDKRQVNKYDIILGNILKSAEGAGRRQEDILCEVLSTLPYTLQRVIEKHSMGRFRVSQKADPENPADVYRCENALPGDWVMMGNHDTKPVWLVIDEWYSNPHSSNLKKRADYLASQLMPDNNREAFSDSLIKDKGTMAHAMAAQLFACPSENIMIFFADLFGMKAVYNVPGVINETNWHLRVPNSYRQMYYGRLPEKKALNIPLALCMAMRSRGKSFCRQNKKILEELQYLAENHVP